MYGTALFFFPRGMNSVSPSKCLKYASLVLKIQCFMLRENNVLLLHVALRKKFKCALTFCREMAKIRLPFLKAHRREKHSRDMEILHLKPTSQPGVHWLEMLCLPNRSPPPNKRCIQFVCYSDETVWSERKWGVWKIKASPTEEMKCYHWNLYLCEKKGLKHYLRIQDYNISRL